MDFRVNDQNLLDLGESLEALQAVVINAVWEGDIEMRFNTFPVGNALGGNKLDRGIVRFCELAALLRTASLFDKDLRATSLQKLLQFANDHADQFKHTTEEQVKAAVWTEPHFPYQQRESTFAGIGHFCVYCASNSVGGK